MSTRNSLPGKVESYEGPKTHDAIIRQIHEDARKRMSVDFIERVVGLFFSTIGIGKHMIAGKNFRIPSLGSFMLSKKGKLIRQREAIAKAEKARKSHNRKMKKYKRKLSNIRKWNKVNDYRKSGGKEPIPFDEFMSITQRKR